MAPFTRGRALVIGVGAYGDPRWDVPTATRDAQGVYDTLIDPDLAGYGRGDVELLLDQQATLAGILAAVTRLANRCDKRSIALISITCHGAPDKDGAYYLATSDTRFTASPDNKVVKGTGLQVAALARALRDIPAGRLLVIVNACSSGQLLANVDGAAVAPDEPVAGQMFPDEASDEILATGDGRAIITASRADQRSYFLPEERHSYFGQALIDGLRGSAASAASGYVGLYELYEAVHQKVRDVTWRRHGILQEPALTVVRNFGTFPLASYPGAARGDDRLLGQAPPAGAQVRVVERDVISASGQGATAIKAEQGSTVTVDNSKLIDFGGATVMGGVSIGNVARGDIININSPGGGAPAEQPPDPARDLPILRERVAVARNVDELQRDIAALELGHAHTALKAGDHAKSRQLIDSALVKLRAMDNGYVRSVVRKIETLRAMI